MTVIRRATFDDVATLAEAGRGFFDESQYGKVTEYDVTGVAVFLAQTLDRGAIWMAERDGRLIGFLAAMMSGLWFCPGRKVASEMAWWIEPEWRGGTVGVRLYLAFEQWAKREGAELIAMSEMLTIAGPAGSIFERLGLRSTERSWIKEV